MANITPEQRLYAFILQYGSSSLRLMLQHNQQSVLLSALGELEEVFKEIQSTAAYKTYVAEQE